MPTDLIIPNEESSIREVFQRHWREIRTRRSRSNRIQDWFNFRLASYEPEVFARYLAEVFAAQSSVFKLNLSFGFILRHTESGNLQYFHASSNNHSVFDEPFLISNASDLQKVRDGINQLDILEWIRQQRPNSKWVVDLVTNVCFIVTKIPEHPIGKATMLPPYILKNKAIVSLECNRNTGVPYEDNLCFFRCLAFHNGCHLKNLERDTKHYLEQ
jgi:hypothetical protein